MIDECMVYILKRKYAYFYRITPQRVACRYRVRETMGRYTPGYTGMPV